MNPLCLSFLGFLLAIPALADPQAAQTISQPNSKCVVKSTAGEYPAYTVYKNQKAIYSPKSDGVTKALISPSGKYVALSAGEMNLLDIEKDQYVYGVVIVNCETGKLKGYRKNQPTWISKWEGEQGLRLSDFLNLSGNSGETLP